VDPQEFFQRQNPLPEEQEAAIEKKKQEFLAIIDTEMTGCSEQYRGLARSPKFGYYMGILYKELHL
jgi:hypothetical protein